MIARCVTKAIRWGLAASLVIVLPSAMVRAQQQDSLSAAQPRAAPGGAPSASDTSASAPGAAASSAVDAAPLAASPPVSTSTLPRDLSPWGMFMQADIIVKAVMIGLAFASLVTWTIGWPRRSELAAARRRALGCVRCKLARAANLACGARRHRKWLDRQGCALPNCMEAARARTASARAICPPRRHQGAASRSRLSRIEATAGREHRARHRRAGDHRRDRALRRTVRHRVGHHEHASSASRSRRPPISRWSRRASPRRCSPPRSASSPPFRP